MHLHFSLCYFTSLKRILFEGGGQRLEIGGNSKLMNVYCLFVSHMVSVTSIAVIASH